MRQGEGKNWGLGGFEEKAFSFQTPFLEGQCVPMYLFRRSGQRASCMRGISGVGGGGWLPACSRAKGKTVRWPVIVLCRAVPCCTVMTG